MSFLRINILAAIILAALSARADDSIPMLRAVTSSYTLEVGTAHLADTYLTPLHYRGQHYALGYERSQAAHFAPATWMTRLRVQGIVDHTKNPAGSATIYNGQIGISAAMMRRWQITDNLTAGVGPQLSVDAGLLYLNRNSNNPVSAKASATVDAAAYVSWTNHLGKLRFTLRYQPSLPLTGAFFSPDYGQLYYQMLIGDTGRVVHAAWWGNYFAMDNLVTADIHMGNTSLRIGYRHAAISTKINNLVTNDISNAFVLGLSTDWIALRPDSHAIDARIISAY